MRLLSTKPVSFSCSHRFTLYLMESVTSLDPLLYDHKPCMGYIMNSSSVKTQDWHFELMKGYAVPRYSSSYKAGPHAQICCQWRRGICMSKDTSTTFYNVTNVTLASLLSFSNEPVEFSLCSPSWRGWCSPSCLKLCHCVFPTCHSATAHSCFDSFGRVTRLWLTSSVWRRS